MKYGAVILVILLLLSQITSVSVNNLQLQGRSRDEQSVHTAIEEDMEGLIDVFIDEGATVYSSLYSYGDFTFNSDYTLDYRKVQTVLIYDIKKGMYDLEDSLLDSVSLVSFSRTSGQARKLSVDGTGLIDTSTVSDGKYGYIEVHPNKEIAHYGHTPAKKITNTTKLYETGLYTFIVDLQRREIYSLNTTYTPYIDLVSYKNGITGDISVEVLSNVVTGIDVPVSEGCRTVIDDLYIYTSGTLDHVFPKTEIYTDTKIMVETKHPVAITLVMNVPVVVNVTFEEEDHRVGNIIKSSQIQ